MIVVAIIATTLGGGSDAGDPIGSRSTDEKPINCQIDEPCDLGPSAVTITKVERTDFIDISYDEPLTGNYVIVDYDYTSHRSQPVSTPYDRQPFVLEDSKGRTYYENTDATNAEAIDREVNIPGGSEDIQPEVKTDGLVIFSVAPDAKGFELRIADLVTPREGKVARLDIG